MDRLNSFKVTLSSGITAALMGTGLAAEEYIKHHNNTFDGNSWFLPVLAVASIFVAKTSERYFTEVLFEFQWFRKLILGPRFIEGFWYYTHSGGGANGEVEKNAFFSDGLAEMKYDSIVGGLKMNIFRLVSDEHWFVTDSIVVNFNEIDGKYFNHFKYIDVATPKEGFASGFYTRALESKVADTYDGVICVCGKNGEMLVIRQKGGRVADKEIREVQKQHPGDPIKWRAAFLKAKKTFLKN